MTDLHKNDSNKPNEFKDADVQSKIQSFQDKIIKHSEEQFAPEPEKQIHLKTDATMADILAFKNVHVKERIQAFETQMKSHQKENISIEPTLEIHRQQNATAADIKAFEKVSVKERIQAFETQNSIDKDPQKEAMDQPVLKEPKIEEPKDFETQNLKEAPIDKPVLKEIKIEEPKDFETQNLKENVSKPQIHLKEDASAEVKEAFKHVNVQGTKQFLEGQMKHEHPVETHAPIQETQTILDNKPQPKAEEKTMKEETTIFEARKEESSSSASSIIDDHLFHKNKYQVFYDSDVSSTQSHQSFFSSKESLSDQNDLPKKNAGTQYNDTVTMSEKQQNILSYVQLLEESRKINKLLSEISWDQIPPPYALHILKGEQHKMDQLFSHNKLHEMWDYNDFKPQFKPYIDLYQESSENKFSIPIDCHAKIISDEKAQHEWLKSIVDHLGKNNDVLFSKKLDYLTPMPEKEQKLAIFNAYRTEEKELAYQLFHVKEDPTRQLTQINYVEGEKIPLHESAEKLSFLVLQKLETSKSAIIDLRSLDEKEQRSALVYLSAFREMNSEGPVILYNRQKINSQAPEFQEEVQEKIKALTIDKFFQLNVLIFDYTAKARNIQTKAAPSEDNERSFTPKT